MTELVGFSKGLTFPHLVNEEDKFIGETLNLFDEMPLKSFCTVRM